MSCRPLLPDVQLPAKRIWQNPTNMEQMNKYYRMVIELFKESLTNVNRVNPDESLRVLTEIEQAITTAKITNQPLDELYQLKADVELVRALNE